MAAPAAVWQCGGCSALGERFQWRRPQSPGSRGHSPGSGDPLGTCGGQEDTGPRGRSCRGAPPRAVQVSAPHARSIQAPTDWGLQELLRELTLGLKSWPPPVLLFLPYVTLCLGWSGATREHGSHRINSSQVAMPLAGAGAAPSGHTPDNQKRRPLPQKITWKETGRASS